MRKNKIKRILSIVMLTVVTTSLSACGSKKEENVTVHSDVSFPLEETATLTMLTSAPAVSEQNPNNRLIFKRLQEKTNVEVDWTCYPDDQYGVCTDVVAFGMKNTGYDLMELVNQDIVNHKENYNIETVDKNIDFRRVRNLNVYFKNNIISLTTDLSKIEEWQGGDIIVFKDHIGVISDKRNRKGIPFLIHHANPVQVNYEEDVLEFYGQDYIIGHYRIS